MAFIFSKTVSDVIRNRNIFQALQDNIQQKKRGKTAPQELPNLAIHGITLNGTYFFCNLIFKKNLTERKKITIFNLIDAYANTEEHAELVRLKAQIKEACGEQVEGIALLFSNANGTYGFVTGNRVKVARWGDTGPIKLDADELFSEWGQHSKLSFQYFIFILEQERDDTSELIRQYLQSKENDDKINTDIINAIKYINTHEKFLEDMTSYLKTAFTVIQNPILREQVKAVFDALQLLSVDDREIKYKATILTLQLLHSQDNEKRNQLLIDYNKLASNMYGSKIPTLMLAGISLLILGGSFLAFSIITSPAIPLYLIIIATTFNLLTGLICGITGKNEYYSDDAKQKRSTANKFFKLKENLTNISENLIPQKINAPGNNSGDGAGITP